MRGSVVVVGGEPNDPWAACLQAVMRIGIAAEDDRPQEARYQLAVDVDGFAEDAITALSGTDRKHVERLCRYLLRGPWSMDRLSNNERTGMLCIKCANRTGGVSCSRNPPLLAIR